MQAIKCPGCGNRAYRREDGAEICLCGYTTIAGKAKAVPKVATSMEEARREIDASMAAFLAGGSKSVPKPAAPSRWMPPPAPVDARRFPLPAGVSPGAVAYLRGALTAPDKHVSRATAIRQAREQEFIPEDDDGVRW